MLGKAFCCQVNMTCLHRETDQACFVVGRDANLHFVEQVALAPPEVQIDLAQQQAYEQQLAEAANAPLPDEDDDLLDG